MKRLLLILLAALLALTMAGAAAEEETVLLTDTAEDGFRLAPGAVGEEVRTVQTRLSVLGYYTGEVSGHYGENTAACVAQFREDFGFEAGQDVDSMVYAALQSTDYRPLHTGSSGADVKRLQTRLAWLGYYGGKVSGNYLAATAAAVKEFQTKTGLPATGDADPATQQQLFHPDAPGKVEKASATPAPAAEEEVLAVPDGEEDIENRVPFQKALAYESRGAQVKLLQERLTELGYYTGPVSGNYLGNTRNAVKAFQKQNALEATGKTNRETWDAIFNDPYVVLPGATPRPSPKPEEPTFHMVVDVTNQVVIAYARDENGEYTVPVKQMICSSGTRANPSDLGDWILSGYKRPWCFFPKWGDYAQYWTRINSGIAFHSVIYNTVSVKDLSVKSYKRLGSRASHGCVRLQVADAKWIYDYVDAGTVVTITQSLPADPELKASCVKPELNYKTMLPVATPRPTQEPVYVSGAKPPLPLRKLEKNSTGEDVYWLQMKLTDLGYYGGKASGTYLDGTAAAVKAFQADHGLRANGVATVETLEAVYAPELSPVPTPTPGPIPTPAP
ncbi:MAG: peptidoglycan-binding protein [Clostridia bacterium]|nr:peptidoglycan-binding protein [Clostridia bacterium]